jgi:acetyl-CoA C-acetyltransferase
MTNQDPVVITGHARTPIGQLLGYFSDTPAYILGAKAIEAAVSRSQLDAQAVNEVIMGCVLPAGQGQAPARQAAIHAGVPNHAGATTVNKMCGSGMKAMMMGVNSILSGEASIVVAGGMENMSLAPYVLPKIRAGLRMGHAQMFDSMFQDGLEDAYDRGQLMGVFAENCATQYHLTRKEQDDFALRSLERSNLAIKNGWFKSEIIPVQVQTKKELLTVDTDELPMHARPEKIPTLKPAFKKDGTVTAANSSGISDGACAHVLMRESEARKRGLKPLAKIIAQATHSQDSAWFTTAPIGAIKSVLEKASWSIDDVDLFEINEAFACVAMVTMKELHISEDKVNVHGGACALGHPIGASGARIVSTLIEALRQRGLKKGIAALCIGGGEATALAIELVE